MVSLTFTHDGLNSPITIALDGRGIHETYSMSMDDGWNLISLPFIPYDMRTNAIFPSSTAGAFMFDDGYIKCDSLEPGKGYWLKFNKSSSVVAEGRRQTIDTLNVHSGWNIIGSFSSSAATHAFLSEPQSIISSHYYGYHGRYFVAESVCTGEGYWVKCSGSGKLFISPSAANSKMAQTGDAGEAIPDFGRLTIRDAKENEQSLYYGLKESLSSFRENLFELPPNPPRRWF